jgi:oligogalacturonide transport system ATP-binding protein
MLGGQALPLPEDKARLLAAAQGPVQLRFGLRPEHISASARPQGDSTAVPGVLHTLEHMGNEVFVHFSIGGVPMTARVPADQQHGLQDLPRGAAHTFHLQMAACHLFDADSGRNLLL